MSVFALSSVRTMEGVSFKSFAMAKEKAFEVLDACPPEVIQRFINRSWRFSDAYRNGLTGWAAAWVVHQENCQNSDNV
jgi:hypothetical protein